MSVMGVPWCDVVGEELGSFSPELALVDPDLAAALRGRPEKSAPARAFHAAALREPTGAGVEDGTGMVAAPPPAVENVREWPTVSTVAARTAARPYVSRRRRRLAVAPAAVLIGLTLTGVLHGEPVTARAPAAVIGSQASDPPLTYDISTATSVTGRLSQPVVAPTHTGAKPSPKIVAPAVSEVRHTVVVAARRFAWAPVPKAVGYRVELFRGSQRVFRKTVRRPGFALPASWDYAGHRMRLRPGKYRWFVWPVTSRGLAKAATVQARLTVL